ncbi:Creatinase/aminopeptidase [Hyaloraphidium curvatum]|nr:Creatinase/aminopeptidase [Hyaloraphidium curvatum]
MAPAAMPPPIPASAPVDTSGRLEKLRALMKERQLGAYIVPTEDAHQSEYIAEIDKRRAYISGFTGSAGTAVVTPAEALLWTDGRYFLQASKELDPKLWTLMKSGMPDVPTKEEWLAAKVPQGSAVGIDPRLFSTAAAKALDEALTPKGIRLDALPDNLVDAVWASQPPRPDNPVSVLEVRYAGKSAEDKLAAVREEMAKKGCGALVLSALDEIAWLYNLRGSDIAYNPVFFAYSVVKGQGQLLYMDESKLGAAAAHLPPGTEIRPYEAIYEELPAIAGTLDASKEKIWLDSRSNLALLNCVRSLPSPPRIEDGKNPVLLAKAVKNSAEIAGFRACHRRDAAALCRYAAWLEKELAEGRKWNEYDAAGVLEKFRSEQADFVGLSFQTISSTGPNAAIIHYAPDAEKSDVIDRDRIYLLDSGGQYRDGTTDVTRTFHFGTPSAAEREAYTLVLKGHIALDTLVVPKGTTGYVVDCVARIPLWKKGLEYRHGTGHGVGSFLNVHEGPHGIGTRIGYNDVGLAAGMTVTNEPGYYKDGEFGIRIENVLVVREAMPGFLGFEHVTLVPLDRGLIVPELLDDAEKKWVDAYHKECWDAVSPLLEEGSAAREWLKKNTLPLSEPASTLGSWKLTY